MVLWGELRDVSPLTVPKPLKDEEEDKREGEILEEAEARREDGTFPIDPRDPEAVV